MVPSRERLAERVLDELRPGLGKAVLDQIDNLSTELTGAGRIVCYGVGREGLMMKALAMRLFHLGLDAHVAGDMTVPPVADGDVLFISAGPGDFSTVAGLAQVARNAGARVLCITATPDGAVPLKADLVIHLPAQTMASDQGVTDNSVLPMGSLFEVLMLVFFEFLVLDLRDRLALSPEAMRANHTNLE
ncbi:SIS domain-containing protein [Primorskyibacter flagellatus]|uniref:SIS domain-containing protein n=1 Tax=Primorskyibacter flagellatus TaxID=1387277 RepID=UPI003A9557F6